MNTRKALLPTHPSGGRLLVLAGAILLATQAPTTLAAQAAEEEAVLPKLTVTAQKREEQAQDVAVALTPLTGKDLEERGITNINQLQYQVPNLEIDPAYGSSQTLFRIRGIGLRDYASNNTSTVGVYIDEVAYPFPVQSQGLLFDLDRVEVLRGPQGTLYGRNSTGGAVNFISRRPTKEFEGEIKAGYASNDRSNLQGFLSGPLTDNLRGRFSFSGEEGGAWQKSRDTGQKLGDKDINAFRSQLEWDARDDLRFNLNLHHAQDKSESRGARAYQGVRPNATNGAGYAPVAPDRKHNATGWGLTPTFAALTGLKVGDKPHRDNESNGISLTANWDIDDHLTLTSISAYNDFKRREYIDWDGTIIPQSDEFFKTDIEVISQELRLGSQGNERFNWVIGGYYSREKLDEQFFSDFSANLGYATLTQYGQNADSYSLFGQGSYALSDTLTLVAGLRQEHEKRELEGFSTQRIINGVYQNPTFNNGDRSLSSDETSAKLALEYRPSEGHLLYASISRGVKSGGFTAYNSTYAEQIDPFKPEKLLAYEIGFKSDLSRSLRLNGALFYYDYRDQQFQSQVYISPAVGNVGRLLNIPKSEIWGAELELQWQPLPGLTIRQNAGYKEGRYKDFQGLDAAATRANGFAFPVYNDFSGDKLTSFPETSYGGSLRYTRPVAGFEWTAFFDYAYHDTLVNADPLRSTNHYWLANARLSVEPVDAKWELAVYARNLFNEEYDLYKGSFLSNAQMAHSGDPRSYGVEVTYRF